MVVLSSLPCILHVIQGCQISMRPIGFMHAKLGVHAPGLDCTCILACQPESS